MLKDKDSYDKEIDSSESVVCPNGEVFAPEELSKYFGKNKYNPKNLKHVMMQKARMYHLSYRSI